MLGCEGLKKKESNSEFRFTHLSWIRTCTNWTSFKILCHGFFSRTYFSNLAEGTGGGDRGRLGGGVVSLVQWPWLTDQVTYWFTSEQLLVDSPTNGPTDWLIISPPPSLLTKAPPLLPPQRPNKPFFRNEYFTLLLEWSGRLFLVSLSVLSSFSDCSAVPIYTPGWRKVLWETLVYT